MTAVAVKVFVIDATAYCMSTAACVPASTSPTPIASDHSTLPPRKTAAVRLGKRLSRCASPTRRENRSSGVGKSSQRPRNQLDRPLDLVIGYVEVRDRAQPTRVGGHREPDAVLPQPRERLLR